MKLFAEDIRYYSNDLIGLCWGFKTVFEKEKMLVTRLKLVNIYRQTKVKKLSDKK